MITEKIDPNIKDTVFVYTTCSNIDEARNLARSAVENNLAVCGDFWAVESIYPWHGVLEDVEQYMLMITTQRELSEKLVGFLKGLHSYEVPMFVTTASVSTSELYKIWMEKTLEQKGELLSPEEAKEKQQYESESGYHPGKLK